MADLAKLVVRLEAESAKLHRDLDRSNKKLNKFERNAKRAGKALKAFGAVGIAGLAATGVVLGVMAKRTLELADRIGKLSQTTGLSVEQLSRLRFQAELTGTNFEAIAKGVVKFQRSMYDAQQGLATQRDAFDDLGVSIVDNQGMLRETDAVMGDMAEAFKHMEDGAKKSALAQVLIGRAGSQMIPFLNAGRDGLKEMADEADALGVTLDGKLTAAAEATNDNISRLKAGLEGVFLRVMAQALPVLERFTKNLVAWAKDSENVEKSMKGIADAMKVLSTVATVVGGVLKLVGNGIGAMAAAASFALEGEFKKAMEVWEAGTEDSVNSVIASVEKVKQTWTDVPNEIAAKADETGKKMAAPVMVAQEIVEATTKEMETSIKKAQKTLENAVKSAAEISKKFEARHQNIIGPQNNVEDANTLDVGLLELQAQRAVNTGDIDTAISKLESAFDILDHMKETGTESSMVLEGLSTSLRNVGEQISDEKLAQVEAKVAVDISGFRDAILSSSAEMQKLLNDNPLVQPIITNTAQIPNQATQAPTGGQNLQPVNLTMPDGSVKQVYGDPANIDTWRRELSLEATKRGTR